VGEVEGVGEHQMLSMVGMARIQSIRRLGTAMTSLLTDKVLAP
jgi:hypothetical protein